MTRRSRAALAACWLIVAFLLLRMAYGGDPLGIIYVVNVTSPALLAAGALTIAGAAAVTILLARGAWRRAASLSIALAALTIPLSLVLSTQDHGSAPAVGGAAVVALVIAIRAGQFQESSATPPPAA